MSLQLQRQHEELLRAYSKLEQINLQIVTALENVEEEQRTLKSEYNRLRNELTLVRVSDQSATINQLNATVANYEREIYELRNEKRILTEEKANLEKDQYSLSGRIHVIERNRTMLEKELELSDKRHKDEIYNLKQEHGREVARLKLKMKEHEQALQVGQNCIELLKEKLDDEQKEVRKLQDSIKNEENKYRLLEIKYENVCEELEDVKQRLNSIESRNREDLADRSCLICTNPMDGSAAEFQRLPKCINCRRRYHRACIFTWFLEKRECPVCKAAANEMENVH